MEGAILRKASLRLLPFLIGGYFLAFLDRVNAGFAALQMNRDVGIDPAAFGLGGGLFFLGYFLFEVPSNLLLERVGARRWIARIMISWGLVSAAMALVSGPLSFYALRLLLGIAEAGFFPGILLFLTYWYPRARRARIVATLMLAVPASNLLGSPLSAALLGVTGLGLRGWQWMFLLEGVPAILLGLAVLRWLPERPDQASWLEPDERAWLAARIRTEAAEDAPVGRLPLFHVLTDRRVLAAAIVYAGGSGASSCLSLWAPQMLKSFGLGTLATGWVNALPYAVAVPAMVAWGFHSDARGERVRHTALPLALIALALGLMAATHALLPTLVLLCIAVAGTYAVKGPFWALAGEWLSASAAAAGIAQINAIGNLGGFLATAAVGAIRENGGSYAQGLLPLAAINAVSAAAVLVLGSGRSVRANAPPPD